MNNYKNKFKNLLFVVKTSLVKQNENLSTNLLDRKYVITKEDNAICASATYKSTST